MNDYIKKLVDACMEQYKDKTVDEVADMVNKEFAEAKKNSVKTGEASKEFDTIQTRFWNHVNAEVLSYDDVADLLALVMVADHTRKFKDFSGEDIAKMRENIRAYIKSFVKMLEFWDNVSIKVDEMFS